MNLAARKIDHKNNKHHTQNTLGIIGGGQLGRMLCQAARKLKIKTIVLDPTPNCPAGQIADKQLVGDFKDPAKIRLLAKQADYLTFEIESANVNVLELLEKQGVKVQPNPKTLATIQDKLLQKQYLLSYSIPTPEFTDVKTAADIEKTSQYLGYPLVLKSRFHGYDGRGNALIKNKYEIAKALKKLSGKSLYIEKFVPFKKELAIQIVRDKDGKMKAFPLVETIQTNNICHKVIFPAGVGVEIIRSAKSIAKKTIQNLPGAGIFAVEMFLTKNNKIVVNEVAPRVHNSGHWTIEGCQSSQFEQHIRAVCNLPLTSIKPRVKAATMVNILGRRNAKAVIKGLQKVQRIDGIYVHIYGKFETRIERKMGHITAIGKKSSATTKMAIRARSLISI